MDFMEISVLTDTATLETAEAICQMVSDSGIYTEDYSDVEEMSQIIAHSDLIEKDLLQKDKTSAKIHIYLSPLANLDAKIENLRSLLAGAGINYSINMAEVHESDWADNWKKYFKPFEVGNRLAVCPTWEEYTPSGSRKVLKIDPGAAFGSGTHETTRLCLETLEEYVSSGERILDIGCGSGILSIAALLLGADIACGVDIDATAVKTAKENGEINGFGEPKLKYLQGDLAGAVEGKFDIITANIVADVIIRLLPDLRGYMSAGGVALLSGIISERSQEVERHIAENGFNIVKKSDNNGWACIVIK